MIAWEPRRRLVHTFTLAQEPDEPTEITARFSRASDADGCTFPFEHGGWHEANASARSRFGDWPVMLDRFAALVASRR